MGLLGDLSDREEHKAVARVCRAHPFSGRILVKA